MDESYALQAEREMWDAIAASERPATERAGYRRLEAKYAGACDSCGSTVAKGQTILYNRRHELRLLCVDCGARADAGEELDRARDELTAGKGCEDEELAQEALRELGAYDPDELDPDWPGEDGYANRGEPCSWDAA